MLSTDLGGPATPATRCEEAGAPAEPADVAFDVPLEAFISGARYTVFLFRTEGTEVYGDASSGAFARVQARYADGAPAFDAVTTAAAEDVAGSGARGRRRRERRLLGSGKVSAFGGRFRSGPLVRPRDGDWEEWGPLGARDTATGRTSEGVALPEWTVVSVYSRGDVLGARAADGAGGEAHVAVDAAQCSAADADGQPLGCTWVTPTGLVRDELSEAVIEVPEEHAEGEAVTVTVSARVAFNGTDAYPNLFLVLATVRRGRAARPRLVRRSPRVRCCSFVWWLRQDETGSEATAGLALLAVSMVVVCVGSVAALTLQWTWCPDCSSKRNGTISGVTDAKTRPPPALAPDDAARGTRSILDVPFPLATGPAYRDVNGSHTAPAMSHPNRYTLAHIDLTNNDVEHLGGIGDFPSLQTLVLDNNNLRSLVGLHGAKGLLGLSVDSNRLVTLRGLWALRSLTWFKAADNEIESLVHARDLPSLEYVCLANNSLKRLDGIANFPGLLNLDVSDNYLTSVEGLDTCGELMGVDVSHNRLGDEAVPELCRLARLKRLVLVDARGNRLSPRAAAAVRAAFAKHASAARVLL